MTQELQAREKMEVASPAEQTKARPVFVPAVDICESETGLIIMADMPGVTTDGLSVDLKDDTLTIRGEVKATDQGRTMLYREYHTGDYYRQFNLSSLIDQDKISAKLKDGVLTLELPKVEKAKPRQIEIKAE
jgi:HSP20 family protein